MKTFFLATIAASILTAGLIAQAQQPSRTSIARFKKLDCTPIAQNESFVDYKGAVALMSFDFISAKPRSPGQVWSLDYVYQTKKGKIVLERIGRGRMTEAGQTFAGTWEEGDTHLKLEFTKKGKSPNTFEYKGELVLEQDFPFQVNCVAAI